MPRNPNRVEGHGTALLPLLLGALIAVAPLVALAQADEADRDVSVPSSGEADATAVLNAAVGQDAADAAGAATLTCSARALRIMAPEISAARISCQVVGAPSSDTSFAVRADRASDAAAGLGQLTFDPLCVGSLVDGAGTCGGFVGDRASFAIGRLTFAGTLEPSGTPLIPMPAASPAPASPVPPVRYQPLPQP